MKYIREGRMGPPKSFKTGAVVGTYPKPLLAFVFDEGGLDVIPPRANPQPKDSIAFDCVHEDIVWVKPSEISNAMSKPMAEQPRITAIDFCDANIKQMDLGFKPTGTSTPYSAFMTTLNAIVTTAYNGTPLPWKTVVLDPVTGLSDVIYLHIGAMSPGSLADARQWASQIGGKVQQTVSVITQLPAHVVIIMHSMIEKHELMGTIIELPKIYSGYRDNIGAHLSQFFYATKENGKPIIWTTDMMYVRGIGARWPQGLPAKCGPDFNSIYGRELGK